MSKNTSAESWKDIKDFPGYQVSNRGRVRNAETDKVLSPFNGSLIVLSKKGKPACRSVPRLVATAFIGPVKKGVRVHKINEEKGYAASNLRIGGASE